MTDEPAAPVRLLLVEDNEVYRESLVFLLGAQAGLEVVGAVGEGASAAQACVASGADVVVLDYRLPDLAGAEVADEIRERCGAAIVFLSASAGDEETAAARRSGAPLVRKDEGVDALVRVLREAAGSVRRRP